MKTLYDISVRRELLWDSGFSEEEFGSEDFFIWYLAKLLSHGTADDIRKLPLFVVAQYLPRLYLPRAVEDFWKWYLKENKV